MKTGSRIPEAFIMKITEEGKKALEDIMAQTKADGLMVEMQESCCGFTPVFRLATFDENDKPEDVDGIKIVIPEAAKELTENLVIDLSHGELVVMNAGCGCGDGHGHGEDGCCGGGHHHHEEGHECCGGHGHHEGGCCSNHE